MRLAIAAFIVTIVCWAVQARDLGQWENVDPAVAAWYGKLKQPDNGYSCCGMGDAYEADEAHVIDGKVIATITDQREDAPLMRFHVPPGTRYIIPPEKITRVDGNPTGHVIIFLGAMSWINGRNDPATRPVLCYVMNAGT